MIATKCGMKHEAVLISKEAGTLYETWQVYAWDCEGDGECRYADFTGPDAKKRAEEYAAFKNRQ